MHRFTPAAAIVALAAIPAPAADEIEVSLVWNWREAGQVIASSFYDNGEPILVEIISDAPGSGVSPDGASPNVEPGGPRDTSLPRRPRGADTLDVVWIRGVDEPGGVVADRVLGPVTVRQTMRDRDDPLLILVSRELGCISTAAWFPTGGPWGGGLPRRGCDDGLVHGEGALPGDSSIVDCQGLTVQRTGDTWLKAVVAGTLTGPIDTVGTGRLTVALSLRERVTDVWTGAARLEASIHCHDLDALIVGHHLAADVNVIDGLRGPIIIGSDGNDESLWDASARITVGPGVPLLQLDGDSQHYSLPASAFGGGSVTMVGQAFACDVDPTDHGVQRTQPAFVERRLPTNPSVECIPVYVIDVDLATDLIIEHYGPVARAAPITCPRCCGGGAGGPHDPDYLTVYRRRARTVDAGFSETGWHADAFTDSGGTNTHWDVDDFAFYFSDLGDHWEVVTDMFVLAPANGSAVESNLSRAWTARPVAGSFEPGWEYVFSSNNFGSICQPTSYRSETQRLLKAGGGPPESGNGYFIAMTVRDACPGDVNLDGTVDTTDADLVMAAFGPVDGVADGGQWDLAADAEGDWGTVDALDLAVVMANLGRCP